MGYCFFIHLDEYLVSRMNPEKQYKETENNSNSYIVLYILLAFALLVLILLGLAMWLEKRKRKNRMQYENHQESEVMKRLTNPNGKGDNKLYPHAKSLSKRNLYPNPEIEEKGSLFEGSMVTTTTTEIQPKAPPLSCEKIDEMSRKSSSFGMVNIHQQQQQSSTSSTTDFGIHNSASNQQFSLPPPSSSSTTNASTVSLAGNSKRMSKMESFPFEEYGIPENERQSINTRVSDLKTYDNFLHLTPVDSELLQGDSGSEDNSASGNEEDRNVGRFESQATLPRSSFDKSTH